MVQVVHVTGIASAVTTPISLGTYIGRGRVAVLTAVRQVINRAHALSMHALAVHTHVLSMHALAPHTHVWSGHNIAVTGAAAPGIRAITLSRGNLFTSSAGVKNFPMRTGANAAITGGTATGANAAITGGTATARAQMGSTRIVYTIDSMGRYVVAATHPAAAHAVLKAHGAAGPRIELGTALQNTDILEIVCLMQTQSGGIFP